MSVLQEEAPPRLPIGTPSSPEEHSEVFLVHYTRHALDYPVALSLDGCYCCC